MAEDLPPELDRRIPLWPQIADYIRRRIESGDLTPGDRVPGIHAIMETFGVTNSTAQKALRALKAEGLVETWSGSGTFVSAPSEGQEQSEAGQ
ncbi:winged helix-turn-helix domain-containing protein [Nonomuraea sp. NPDC050663]|uniref:winged helix-turn-helix domain-containing protein n=1 Tax=Nonomuraea sp. NPDC050663 TaxID=3364370 RepID=UPI003787D9A6